MRITVCVVTFVILLLIGFLAPPAFFNLVNPGYLLAQKRYSDSINKLTLQLSEIDSNLTDARAKISKLEIGIKDISSQNSAKLAAMQIAKATPEDISLAGIDSGAKANALANQINEVDAERRALVEKRAAIDASLTAKTKSVAATETDSNNIYLVARALALGAIGALMSILAKHLAAANSHPLFEDNTSLGRMWASMTMGGVVAVVVVGLFLTGFISIFANTPQNNSGVPIDYWKVTILCLLAGAFSDRLFQEAASRVDRYFRPVEAGTKAQAKPDAASI